MQIVWREKIYFVYLFVAFTLSKVYRVFCSTTELQQHLQIICIRPEIIDIEVTELLQILAIVLQRSTDWVCHASKSFSNEEPWSSCDKWWRIWGKGFDKLQVVWKQP